MRELGLSLLLLRSLLTRLLLLLGWRNKGALLLRWLPLLTLLLLLLLRLLSHHLDGLHSARSTLSLQSLYGGLLHCLEALHLHAQVLLQLRLACRVGLRGECGPLSLQSRHVALDGLHTVSAWVSDASNKDVLA